MKKHIYLYLLLLVTIVASTSFTLAQSETATTSTTTQEVYVPTEPGPETVVEPVVATEPVGLIAKRQTRIINLAANISNKLEAIAARFETIAERIERRMAKMEAEGFDVTQARVSLEKAKTQTQDAKNALVAIDTLVTQMSASSKPRDGWITVRSAFKTAFTSLRESKVLLRESLQKLTAAERVTVPEETTASTTEATLEN